MRNRLVPINFDCHRPISGGINRGREKEEEGEEKPGVLSSRRQRIARAIRHPRAISSPREGRRNVSPRGEKERGDQASMPCAYRSIPDTVPYRAQLGTPIQTGMANLGS
ncbi:hypothetical protein GW17_00024658 [Ensete ventricosum]|nr:hypothetical protein GW17_00024658 [Ensete ventricosum]